MKVHLFIQICVLSSKIEWYHLEFDSNWAISFNILPNFLSNLFFIAFEQKIAQKRNASVKCPQIVSWLIPKIPWDQKLVDCCLGSLCEEKWFFSIFSFGRVNYIFHKFSVNTKHVKFRFRMSPWWSFVENRCSAHFSCNF
jgi:hypothetical protein